MDEAIVNYNECTLVIAEVLRTLNACGENHGRFCFDPDEHALTLEGL